MSAVNLSVFNIVRSPRQSLAVGQSLAWTATANGAGDPAGIAQALYDLRQYVCPQGSEIAVAVPEGQFSQTGQIRVTQSNARNIKLQGVSITLASSGGAPQVVDITKVADQKYDVTFQWYTSGLTTGLIVGNGCKIRAFYASTSGAARVFELAGGGPITAVNSGAKQFTVRLSNTDLDAAIEGATIAVTNIRILRTRIKGLFTWSAAHQGFFNIDPEAGIQVGAMMIDGGRVDAVAPSSGAPDVGGTADTCGVLIQERGYFRGLDHLMLYGWDYPMENLGGYSRCNDVALCFANNNCYYGQYGARANHTNCSTSGGNIGVAVFSGSRYYGANHVCTGNGVNVRSSGKGTVAEFLGATSRFSSSAICFDAVDGGAIQNFDGEITAPADYLGNAVAGNNTLKHQITNVGFVAYNDNGRAILETTPTPAFVYIPGEWYSTFEGSGTSTIIAAADKIYLQPFRVRSAMPVDRLGVRVTTGQSGSSVKGAIYATRPSGTGIGRPFGAPLAVDNTGVATATSNAEAALTLSAVLQPGITYWSALKFTASGTLPTCNSTLTTSRNNEALIGRGFAAGAAESAALLGLSWDQSYGTDFPTFDGSETWTPVTGAALPIVSARAA